MNGTDINELVERAKNGDKAAIDELYRAYYDQLLKFVTKQGVSEFDAQDVVSETFVEMMKHIEDLRENAYFSTWLHTIAKRKAQEHLEKASRRQRVTFDTADSEDSGLSNLGGDEAAVELAYENTYGDTVMLPADYAENEEIKQIIAEQISSLSDEHKEALFLFYYQNKSIAEIAELTGTNQNNVKARLFHARKNLRKKLEALRKKGVVLCAVPFASLIPHFGSLLSGALGAGTAAAVGATAGTMTTSGAASVAATGAAAGTMTTGGAASAAATGAAAGLGAGAAGSAAVTGAVAGFSKTGKGAAAATTSGFGMKAIIITIVTVVTVTVTTVVVTKFTSGKDDDDKKASSSAAVMAEPESRTEAVSRTDSDEDDSSVPEVEADAVLVMPDEEIPITFGEVNYRAWQHPDLTKDHAYVFIQGFSPEYSDKWLLTEYKDKELTPIESEDGGFCTIESKYIPAHELFFRNGSALFIGDYDWYAVFPSEGRIDVHSTEQNGPEDNWFYGMVFDESGDVYDGTYEPPVDLEGYVIAPTFADSIQELGDYSMMIMPYNFTVEIDPDTLRPIVEAPKDESWKAAYVQTIKNCVPDDFAGTDAKMSITFIQLENDDVPMCYFKLYEDPVLEPGQRIAFPTIHSTGFMAVKDNQVVLTQESSVHGSPDVYKKGDEKVLRFENYSGFATRDYSYFRVDNDGLTHLSELDWLGEPPMQDPNFSVETGYTEAETVSNPLPDVHSLAEMEEAIMNYEPEQATE